MIRRSIITAAVLTLLAPATAAAKSERQKYIGIRVEAEEQLDKGEVGPDLRHTGVKSPSGKTVRAKARHFAEAYRDLRDKVDPPPVPVASSGGGYSIPAYIVRCESGGSWTAVNTSNPQRPAGAYQIITGTWLAHGGGQYAPTADQATPSQQSEIAARIWDGGAGAGQWACA